MKWISIKEHLPEILDDALYSEIVIVALVPNEEYEGNYKPHTTIGRWQRYHWMIDNGEPCWVFPGWSSNGTPILEYNVTHWIPLPEMPLVEDVG